MGEKKVMQKNLEIANKFVKSLENLHISKLQFTDSDSENPKPHYDIKRLTQIRRPKKPKTLKGYQGLAQIIKFVIQSNLYE